MEYISRKLRDITFLFSPKIKPETPRKFKNVYLETIFKVLSWSDPYLSWCSFLSFNILFWLAVQFELKVLGISFFVVLILFIYDNLFNSADLPDTENSYSEEMEQFILIINSFISAMCGFRKESPSAFCLVMSLFFLILSFIARNLSGLLFTYIMILGLFFLPVGYKRLPIQLKNGIKESLKLLLFHGVIDENDLIPLESKEYDGEDGEIESLDTDKTAESVSNSLISGISSMPSFLDAEDNHEILEEDLLPINELAVRGTTQQLADISSDSDSDIRDMNFRDSHFSKDTSSDEGNKFEEGLHFSEDSVDSVVSHHATNRLFHDLVTYATSTSLSNIMNNAISNLQGPKVTHQNSSSESDFEIIDHEDTKQ